MFHAFFWPKLIISYIITQFEQERWQILFHCTLLIPAIIWMVESWIWSQRRPHSLGKGFHWQGAIGPSGQISEETEEWNCLVPQSVSGNQTFLRRKAGSAPQATSEQKPSQGLALCHSALPLGGHFGTCAEMQALSCWTLLRKKKRGSYGATRCQIVLDYYPNILVSEM